MNRDAHGRPRFSAVHRDPLGAASVATNQRVHVSSLSMQTPTTASRKVGHLRDGSRLRLELQQREHLLRTQSGTRWSAAP